MSITPNITMICIDIQGEEHHCRHTMAEKSKELGNHRVEQKSPANMRVRMTNLKDTYSWHGRLPIGARHSTKSRVISPGFAERASARKP
jgi:hypothetical protein